MNANVKVATPVVKPVVKKVAAPVARAPKGCALCRKAGPTRFVDLNQNIGLMVARVTKSTRGELCESCIRSTAVRYSLVTGTLGWFGMISFFMTPIILLTNTLHLLNLSPTHSTRSRGARFAAFAAVPLALFMGLAGLVALAKLAPRHPHAPRSVATRAAHR